MSSKETTFKIRHRQLRGYSKEAQGYIGWYEWQLVEGRKIIGRYDTERQAVKAMTDRIVARKEGAA
jgi:hypothetical protein